EITSKDLGTKNIPLGLITLAAVSMTLLQNVTLVEDFSSFFSPEKTVQNRRIQSSSKSRTINPNDQYGLVLSPQVEARLRECLQENLKKLLGISSLSELIESLNKDTQDSRSRFQLQIIYSYKRVQELRKTIEECDSTLIREIMAAEERQADQVQSQATLRIVGEVVNIRAEPSLDGEVIRQVSSDTIVQLPTRHQNVG
ncbi:MAG: SH3 domain-containing protein, partial [Leptolyngbyaceae cyanobacterium CAN_BIN12]|nr:SH3 domain-containing protein [Leptolyngbyaceae cyanobacterium CAN_BIN12]